MRYQDYYQWVLLFLEPKGIIVNLLVILITRQSCLISRLAAGLKMEAEFVNLSFILLDFPGKSTGWCLLFEKR